MKITEENYKNLMNFVFKELRVDLFGVGGMRGLTRYLHDEIKNVGSKMNRVVVIGRKISDAVIDTIIDKPTQIYKTHYQQLNYILDRDSLEIAAFIERLGGKALPIPASHYVDPADRIAHFSHRHAAVAAGLGWIGRNNLLITPEFGAYQRLTSILTDLPLALDKPSKMDCGDCNICVRNCPAGALSKKPPYYDHEKCFTQLEEFRKLYKIGHHICGLCIKDCKGSRNK
ncbi:epoxyqueuosine reductase [bacterium]|nr:epoxyqueuosine reductase [bacterium]